METPRDDHPTVTCPDPTAGPSATSDTEGQQLLLVVSAKRESQAVALHAGAVVTIGRSAAATVKVVDPSLSRLHARFHREGDAVVVVDLGSRNGTLVAGRRVEEPRRLVPGDAAVLGNVTVEVQVAPSRQAAVMGLLGYEGIHRRLEGECARARGSGRGFSLVLLRPRRRASLSAYGAECLSVLRSIDVAGAYDRHSLVVVLPETDEGAARAVARDLMRRARSTVDVGAGVATFPASGTNAAELVAAAVHACQASGADEPGVAREPGEVAPRTAELVGGGSRMLAIGRLIERVAPAPLPILVLGETGTGKEVIARRLHDRSPRRSGPLVAVNCGAIPQNLVESTLFGHVRGAFTGADRAHKGVFERAHEGTVFLDEVGELSPVSQAALLRVLDTGRLSPVGGTQEVQVDARLVAATHRDLEHMVADGRFRLDLFHRLNGVTIELPPLRERREEIAPLARHFLLGAGPAWNGHVRDIAPSALALLERYDWPGNVRELRNVIERARALTEGVEITPDDLPPHVIAGPAQSASTTSPRSGRSGGDAELDFRKAMRRYEMSLLERALERTNGHQRRAAALLKLPLRTLERKLGKLGSSGGSAE